MSATRRQIGTVVALALATVALLAVAAPALAAPPANDNFAARTVLPGSLPLEVAESNAEATRELGENINDFAKGHSIWWEWQAPSSGWTTVSVCGSEIAAVVGIFEGTALGTLKAVARGNAAEGPQCLFQQGRTYTFQAVAGSDYVIGADGNGFYIPEQTPPSGEGLLRLRIEATPVPPNDLFAAATPITGSSEGHNPVSEDNFYYASVQGYNWGATKEAGEPAHGGDLGGASVWYRWIAPRSGSARFNLCCGPSPAQIGIYAGSALDALTPVAGGHEAVEASVVAGDEYRIAIDGARDGVTGEPREGSFQLQVLMRFAQPPSEPAPPGSGVAAASSPPPPSSATVRAPATSLGRRTVDAASGTATMTFGSSSKGARFRCALDGAHFKACTSPKRLKGLRPGRHRFEVEAVVAGKADPTPAVTRFTIAGPRHGRHSAR
jgi:hypothetical protein